MGKKNSLDTFPGTVQQYYMLLSTECSPFLVVKYFLALFIVECDII